MKKKYWYPTAFSCWDDAEQAAIERVRASGQYTTGPEVEAFEREFAQWHGRKHAVMCNSGSSANLLMISALVNAGLLPAGAVARVPALAWATTYAPLKQHNIAIRLLDCDLTWNANSAVQHNVAPGWRRCNLVVGCLILGNPANLAELKRQADDMKAIFIEDNCESFGARTFDNRLTGTFGLMSSFSFFYSHQISAIEGGAVLTDDDDLNRILRMLRSHGWTRDTCDVAAVPFEYEYDFRLFGYNLRSTEMHAAIARAQLAKQEEHHTARMRNVRLWRKLTFEANLPIVHQITHIPETMPNPFGLAFTVEQSRRIAVVRALRAADIDCRLPTGGSFRKHHYGMGHAAQLTPFADSIHDEGLFLGNGPLDLSEQIHKAVSVLEEVLR